MGTTVFILEFHVRCKGIGIKQNSINSSEVVTDIRDYKGEYEGQNRARVGSVL